MSTGDATALLLARAADLAARAANGEITHTAFLTPPEQKQLACAMPAASFILNGGYDDAERKRALFLPPWLAEVDEDTKGELLKSTLDACVQPLEICGSGFRALTHKDHLGAVLNLGIERDAIGDLCVLDPHRAVLFCDETMVRFLTEHLTRVANDAVRVRTLTLPADFDGGRRYERITDTIASARADSIVAALTRLSREKAGALFTAGLVEIDYEIADKPERHLSPGAIIVIRGKGKFIIRALSDKTKKGRLRLQADKYL